MSELFGVLSFVVGLAVTVPYIIDVIKGRAVPARSTRILLFVLLVATLTVQVRDFTSWVLAFTVAQVISTFVLFVLSMKFGVGGLSRIDIAAYALFSVAIASYLITNDALVGLVLLCTTDFIAFAPTLIKTWKLPTSETPLFFIGGSISAALSVLSASSYTDAGQVLFPLYIVFLDLATVACIFKWSIVQRWDSFKERRAV